jgi:hypothetical protein
MDNLGRKLAKLQRSQSPLILGQQQQLFGPIHPMNEIWGILKRRGTRMAPLSWDVEQPFS